MVSLSGVFTAVRILFTYGPGFTLLILLERAINSQRLDIVDPCNRVQDVPFEAVEEYYDFIVVGGGAAGAVVAARLTEIPSWSVLLLEAGPDETVMSEIPQLFPSLQRSELDWQFRTEASGEYCLMQDEGRCNWPRGKVLGGSSTINAMLYVRGNAKDYDRWASLGNAGWSYKDVLPYFKKCQDMAEAGFDDYYHGRGGPLTVEYFRTVSPLLDVFLNAAEEMGLLNPTGDYNGRTQYGFARSQGTIRDGRRCSTAKAYLRPADHRPNLHISLKSFVERIIINPETNVAKGVVYVKDRQRRAVYAKREVILSAGAIQSPQILMLSGIGPEEVLHEHYIDPIYILPGVGCNLQDHVAMGGGTYLIKNPASDETLSFIVPKLVNVETIREFVEDDRGALFAMPAAEAMAFINSKYQDPAEDWPDLQLFLGAYSDGSDGGMYSKRANGMSHDYYANVYEPIIYEDTYMVTPLLMRPRSRGKILLRSSNPYDYPIIHANYFQDPYDLDVLVSLSYNPIIT